MSISYEEAAYKIYLYSLSVNGNIPTGEKFPAADIEEISSIIRYVDMTRNALSSAIDNSLIEAGFNKDLVRSNIASIRFDCFWNVKKAHPCSGHKKDLCLSGRSPVGIKYSVRSGGLVAHKVIGSNEVIYVKSEMETHLEEK